jgi:hypothetical protein
MIHGNGWKRLAKKQTSISSNSGFLKKIAIGGSGLLI